MTQTCLIVGSISSIQLTLRHYKGAYWVNDNKQSKMCDRKYFEINCYVLHYRHISADLTFRIAKRKENGKTNSKSTILSSRSAAVYVSH